MSDALAIVVDAERCTGCRLCELACADHHGAGYRPSGARIRVKRDAPSVATPLRCVQCEEHPCMGICEPGAISNDQETGVLAISDACIGCRRCERACPYGGMFFDRKTRLAIVCDMCDGDPQCVRACATGTIRVVEVAEAAEAVAASLTVARRAAAR